ncbi:hypothetical protein FYB76_26365 [Herbaspirillum sp. CAH-3]|nr:hypothetical protein [Herbaspirillum sp. CAH-3]
MMEWENLVGLKSEAISNGAIFRAEAEWPYEEKVDFMLVDYLWPKGITPFLWRQE